jgi:hypothetical protein
MPTPRPFPVFEPVGGLRVRIPLSTGQTVECDLDQIQSPLDIVPSIEHPDFEAAYAALRWFRARGLSADQAFADPNLIQQYLAATFTPMEVL